MTAQHASDGQVQALEWTVLADGLHGILRTGGCKTAGGRCQGRDAPLVEVYWQEQEPRQHGLQTLQKL